MMWKLTETVSPVLAQAANEQFFAALMSPRMMIPPFGRGYERHSWDVVPGTCDKQNVEKLGIPAPMFADYLDALVCAGMSPDLVDAATEPDEHYPYPSANPICEVGN